MALTVPACVLLATLAGPLVRAVYGERWIAAANALAVLGLMRVAFMLTNNCSVAADKRSTLMGIQGLWLAALIPVLLVGARLSGHHRRQCRSCPCCRGHRLPDFPVDPVAGGHYSASYVPRLFPASPRRSVDDRSITVGKPSGRRWCRGAGRGNGSRDSNLPAGCPPHASTAAAIT